MTTDVNTTDINSSEYSSQAQQPFPNSRKVYVQGSRGDIRVPMREITLSPTQTTMGVEENPPIMVYDTSGPYTDPDVEIDLEKGLEPIRQAWIEERADTESGSGHLAGHARAIEYGLQAEGTRIMDHKPHALVPHSGEFRQGVLDERHLAAAERAHDE